MKVKELKKILEICSDDKEITVFYDGGYGYGTIESSFIEEDTLYLDIDIHDKISECIETHKIYLEMRSKSAISKNFNGRIEK